MDFSQTDLNTGERASLISRNSATVPDEVHVTVHAGNYDDETQTPFFTSSPHFPRPQRTKPIGNHFVQSQTDKHHHRDEICLGTDENTSKTGQTIITINLSDTSCFTTCGQDDQNPDSKCQHLDKDYGRKQDNAVLFHVGKGRQVMIGIERQLASISPVFAAMLGKKWRRKNVPLEIPDISTQTFGVILRCAAGDIELGLGDDNVWDVLRAADEYQVTILAHQCFHFLLHEHSCRQRSRHICMVLETAHALNYEAFQKECIILAKRKGNQVFKSESALKELCHECMMTLVQADDLRVGSEMLVNDAVVTWARCACVKKGMGNPSLKELKDMAGSMSHHVRYLTMPATSLKNLRNGPQLCCLLSEQELEQLLHGNSEDFPEQVGKMRIKEVSSYCKMFDGLTNCVSRAKNSWFSVFFLIGLLLLILFAIISISTVFATKNSQTENKGVNLGGD